MSKTFICDLSAGDVISFSDYPTLYTVESVKTEGAYTSFTYTCSMGRFAVVRTKYTTVDKHL